VDLKTQQDRRLRQVRFYNQLIATYLGDPLSGANEALLTNALAGLSRAWEDYLNLRQQERSWGLT